MELTTSPYSGSWNTIGISNGNHTLTATARDAAGNTRTSNPVTITINNNTAPILSSIGSKTVTTGTQLSFTVLGSDAENNTLIYTTTSLPSDSTFSNRTFTWTPSVVGVYTPRFTISDGTLSDFENVTITVIAPLPLSLDRDSDGVADATDRCPDTPPDARSRVNLYGCPKPFITKFTIVPDPNNVDIKSLSSMEIYNTYGKVEYESGSYALVRGENTLDIDSNMTIDRGTITINSTNLPEFNKPAKITLSGLTLTTPVILKDGILCTTCTVVSYTGGTLIFRVSSFSTYTVEETVTPTTGGGSTYNVPPVDVVTSTGTFNPTVSQRLGTIVTTTSNKYLGLSQLLRSLYRGLTGEDVRTLQRFLVIEGLLTIDAPTTYFGILTEASVKAFQARNNIVSSGDPASTGYGAVGPKTRTAINALISSSPQTSLPTVVPSSINVPITKTLIYDMTDPQVVTLQSYLISKGYLTSQPTGYFGNLTLTAVKKFQCEKLSICSGTAETSGWGVVGGRTRAGMR